MSRDCFEFTRVGIMLQARFLFTLAYKLFEVVPFLILWRDAFTSQVREVSAQTCAALTFAKMFSLVNQPVDAFAASVNLVVISMVCVIGWCCTFSVAKYTDVGSEDDLIPRWSMPRAVQWMTLYLVTLLMTIVVSLAAFHFSFFRFTRWVRGYPVFLICTLQNFLHGMALNIPTHATRSSSFIFR